MKPQAILKSKLNPPDYRQMVLRRRLLEKAVDSEERLVIICADAGYGKTTMMAQLSASYQGKSLWYQLGPEDRDLAVFLTHLTEGLKGVVPGFGGQIGRALKNTEDVAADRENIMMVLISEMLEFTKEPLTICFDEFRHINDSKSTLTAVQFLVKHLPADFRIMIASREKPNLILGRLRSQRQLLEFGTGDLRFDREETAELLADCCSPRLTERELEEWVEATDGWPIALLLSKNLLKTNSRRPAEILKDLVDTSGSIATYLAEELFFGLSGALRDFMMRSSLPDLIDTEICDITLAAGGEAGYSMKYIREIEDRNLMAFRLETGKRYRYQKMAQQFLRRKLSETLSPQEIAELNLRYGDAYEQRGDFDNAIRHYQDSGEIERVTQIIEGNGEAILAAGRYEALAGWISAIPGNVVEKQPMLTYFSAKTYMKLGEMKKAESMLAIAEAAFVNTGDRHGAFICVYSLADLYFLKEKYQKSLELVTRALSLTVEPLERVSVLARMTELNLVLGDTSGAFQALGKADEEIDDSMAEAQLLLSVEKMVADSMTGDFRASMESALRLEKEVTAQTSMQTYFNVLYFRTLNLRESGQYQEALTTVDKASAYMDNRDKVYKLVFDFQKAVILLCMGEVVSGSKLLKQTFKKLDRLKAHGPYFTPISLGNYYRWFGMPEKAIELLVPALRSSREKEKISSVANLLVNLGANRLRLSDSADDSGMAELEEAGSIAAENNYRFVLTQVFFYQAWHAIGQGDQARALDRITKSLDIAVRYQHNNFILQEGKISLELLAFAFEQDVHRDYLIRIFENIGPMALAVLSPLTRSSSASVRLAVIPALVSAGGTKAAPHVRRLIRDQDANVRRAANAELSNLRTRIKEPGKILTVRENQVFKMMARGHSNAEISQDLFISEPTVKSHVTKIFQKLGMTRRSQAAVYFQQGRHAGDTVGED